MPIEHRVDIQSGIMYVRRWGAVTTQDERRALKRRAADPLVRPHIPVLVDCREVDPPDSTEVVQYLANRIAAIAAELNCGPVAIVVGSEVEYGMARMYMALTELDHPEVDVFLSVGEALQWLSARRPKP